MTWTVETLDKRVNKELSAFPVDVRANFVRIAELLQQNGPDAVGMPHVRHLGNGLWEIRAKGKDVIGRAIYVKAVERRLVVVHAFVKKTQKTPRSALNTAKARAKEVK